MRLSGKRQFEAVYGARVRVSAGPLVVWAMPNELAHPRLGLAVSRRVGNAVVRNRIRRLLRESFRHLDEIGGYDLVINVRRHKPMPLDDYRKALERAIGKVKEAWK